MGYRNPTAIGDAVRVSTSTSAERVRTQLDSLAGAGLDTATFTATALDVLTRAVPFSAACLATSDPATDLVTAAFKQGGLNNDRDDLWAHLEYEVPDYLHLPELLRRGGLASTVAIEADGDLRRSTRHTELLNPHYSIHDELRVAFRADGATWGFACLFRDRPGDLFSPAEVEFVGSLSSVFATGLRAGMLAAARVDPAPTVDGPAVLIVGADDEVVQATLGAQARVTELGGGALGSSQLPLLLNVLVGAAASSRPAASPPCRAPAPALRVASGSSPTRHRSPAATVIAVTSSSPLKKHARRRSCRSWSPRSA